MLNNAFFMVRTQNESLTTYAALGYASVEYVARVVKDLFHVVM